MNWKDIRESRAVLESRRRDLLSLIADLSIEVRMVERELARLAAIEEELDEFQLRLTAREPRLPADEPRSRHRCSRRNRGRKPRKAGKWRWRKRRQ